MSRGTRALLVAGVVACAGIGGVWAFQAARSSPATFVRTIPWANRGVWLRADLHAHTTFSDGNHSPEDVVAKAAEYGCDVVAITDHTDGNLKAATPEYLAAITSARTSHPAMTVLAGLEWNIPPGKGDDHVSVLLPPALEQPALLGEFKDLYDDYNKRGENPELADEALRWASGHGGQAGGFLFFLNHPSRKLARSDDRLEWIRRWRSISPSFAGMEGAPGHQRKDPVGAYKSGVRTIDRWDPMTANVGGVWDRLLGEGLDLWASTATSDFHSWDNGDYWPCQFSETRIYARDRTAPAILDALRAGSFFGVHGRVVSDARLALNADGLEREAQPGEIVRVGAGKTVRVSLTATVPPKDWDGQDNTIERLDLIVVDATGARLAAADRTGDTAIAHLVVPAGGLVVRARGCRNVPNAPGLCFSTNPIRVVTSSRR